MPSTRMRMAVTGAPESSRAAGSRSQGVGTPDLLVTLDPAFSCLERQGGCFEDKTKLVFKTDNVRLDMKTTRLQLEVKLASSGLRQA